MNNQLLNNRVPQTPAAHTLLASFLLIWCLGCKSSIHQQQMTGKFDLHSSWGCGWVELQTNHSFHQELAQDCRDQPLKVDGKWSIELSGSEVDQVSFSTFLGKAENGTVENVGLTYLAIEKYPWSPIRLLVDQEFGSYYQKVDTHQ